MVNIAPILRDHLERYDILERIGSGGMATVFRAKDTNLGRDVAIKVLHDHLVQDETFRDRFEQEARFIASFNHPNIVQIYDFSVVEVEDAHLYYMVMPVIRGDSLDSIIRDTCQNKQTLSHDRINAIIRDIAAALDYAHERGMVHRDVKPANILFDDDRAILTDFGIARLAQDSHLTADGTIIGTPTYMSPEQATGDDSDHRSDIYSLGIILYEMLTGRVPFDSDSTVSLLLKHAETPPPPPSSFNTSLSTSFDQLLLKALAKDADDRYQTASALADALDNAIVQEDTEQRAQPGSVSSRPAATQQFDTPDNASSPSASSPPERSTVAKTITTLVLEPAKQNPMALVSLVVAMVALIIVARFTQMPTTTSVDPASVTTVPGTTTNRSSMTDDSGSTASMTEEDFYFRSDFNAESDTNTYWEQNANDTIIRNIADDTYIISVEPARTATTALFDPVYTYDNVKILLNGTISDESAGNTSAMGIVFRYQDDDNYNVFAIDGDGQYSLWRLEDGTWRELRDADDTWTPDDAINPIGEENQLSLTIINDRITATVNRETLVTMDEDGFDSGGVGIYVASTSAGGATAIIDAFSTVETGTPSMTDDGR